MLKQQDSDVMAEQALTNFSHHANDKPVVLIADDSRVVRVSLKNILKDECHILEAENGREAWDFLCDTPSVALIFSDLSMPELDGRGLLAKIRSADSPEIANTPFIVVTGNEESTEIKEELAQLGADEVINKPFDATNIKNYLTTLGNRVQDHDALQSANDTSHQQPLEPQSDYLQGVADREQFLATASRELAFAIRNKNELAISLVKIDQIDEIIEHYSEPAIDHILHALAEIISQHIHPDDTLAYFGKGLFAMLRPASNAIGTRYLGRRILEDLASKHFYLGESDQIISASIAISAPDIKPGTRLAELISLAEGRLKAAMENGGNKVVDKGNEILTPVNLLLDTSELTSHSVQNSSSTTYSNPSASVSRSSTEIHRLAAEQVAEIKARYGSDPGEDDQDSELIEHKQTIERLTNENRQLINEIAHWKKQSAESENLRRQLFEVESQQQQMQLKFNELQNENRDLRQDAEALAGENAVLLQRFEALEAENSNLLQRTEVAESVNQALIIEERSHANTVNETQTFFEEANRHLESQVAELTSRAEKAEVENIRSNQLVSSLKDNVKLLHMQLDQLQQQLKEERQKNLQAVSRGKHIDADSGVVDTHSQLKADTELLGDSKNSDLVLNPFPDTRPISVPSEPVSVHLFPDQDQIKSKTQSISKTDIPPFRVEPAPLIFKNGFNPSSFTIASIIFAVILAIGGAYLYQVFTDEPVVDESAGKSSTLQNRNPTQAVASRPKPVTENQKPPIKPAQMTPSDTAGAAPGSEVVPEELRLEKELVLRNMAEEEFQLKSQQTLTSDGSNPDASESSAAINTR
jgi:diguanylate cyclase (GGDEF)-like protein